jgi:cytidylate kinase
MDRSKPFAITISRQIGSGGAYIGQQLAKKLNIYYSDREILNEAAQKLAVLDKDLEEREEKLQTFWDSFFQFNTFATDMYLNPILIKPSSYELFITESEIIKHIASEQSCVIIGRCGYHILKEHPNRISIFLFADKPFRCKRIQELQHVSEKTALDMIVRTDKDRANFIEEYTGKKWTDAQQFDLCINTGKIGLDKSGDLIIQYLESI